MVGFMLMSACTKQEPASRDIPVKFYFVILDSKGGNMINKKTTITILENGTNIKFDRYQIIDLRTDKNSTQVNNKYGGLAISINPNIGTKYSIKNDSSSVGVFMCDGVSPTNVIFNDLRAAEKIDSTVFPFVQVLNLKK